LSKDILVISGTENGKRVSSRVIEERVQDAVRNGSAEIHITADGQHGIGGRVWPREGGVRFTVDGPVGQRLGSMGMFGTEITVRGNVSDDVGWLNCGARITVLGDAANGAHNAAAQGVLYVQGGAGARCDTMTKHNPKFDPPESWYFRDVGDAFAEFKAGGIAVICGVNPRNPNSILGYRPCVGMVGGVVYFRGPIQDYSAGDVRLLDLTDADWQWLTSKMRPFLAAIEREDHYEELTVDRSQWKKLLPFAAQERAKKSPFKMSIDDFRKNVWDAGVGKGGIFAEYLTHPLTVLPYVTTGDERRHKPIWNNRKYAPPCEFACPSGIPTQRRASLIRAGRVDEALELILQYSPFPATVCGEVCPNLCMTACTRAHVDRPLNIKGLGSASLKVKIPKSDRKIVKTGKKVAIIGGGPGGLSAAWRLALKGHAIDVYEAESKLGGKLELCIPKDRLPAEILKHELDRIESVGIKVHLKTRIDPSRFKKIYDSHDAVIVASGAHRPRMMNIAGVEDMVSAYEFLRNFNLGKRPKLKDKTVIIIGAGNVGMDVAACAYHCGASEVTAVDVQQPAAFGKELDIAKSLGTKILWPKFTKEYIKSQRELRFTDGSAIIADYVVMSIGDLPKADFLPASVHTDGNGWIESDEAGHTSDARIFAVGDTTKLGLVTHAIGHAGKAADAVHDLLSGKSYFRPQPKPVVQYARVKTAYYEICRDTKFSVASEGHRCMSCAVCRDCHMCEATCHQGAIKRCDVEGGGFEYVVDESLCIGCSFCAGVCPCGIWEMVENK
jgi:NADPH-dependent glutamate synthase beta subunit-like oxidoreductase/glutamate synthase domain-containing protein 3